MRDEANLPANVQEIYQQQILDLVLYDPEECKALRDFETVQMNTHCLFSKKAVLWGARDYEQSLSLGKCVVSVLYEYRLIRMYMHMLYMD